MDEVVSCLKFLGIFHCCVIEDFSDDVISRISFRESILQAISKLGSLAHIWVNIRIRGQKPTQSW